MVKGSQGRDVGGRSFHDPLVSSASGIRSQAFRLASAISTDGWRQSEGLGSNPAGRTNQRVMKGASTHIAALGSFHHYKQVTSDPLQMNLAKPCNWLLVDTKEEEDTAEYKKNGLHLFPPLWPCLAINTL